MAIKTLSFRLAIKDDERVKQRLRDLGVAGQRSMEKIERSGMRASRGLMAVNRASGALTAGMGLLARRLLFLIGPAALGLLTKRALDNADAIAKQADAIGIGTAAFQEYRFAANLSGVETEALSKSFTILAKRIGEARQRTSSELTTGLKELNPELLETIKNSQNLEEALDPIFKAMAAMAVQTDRVGLSTLVFGRGGAIMVNMVREGTGALEAMRQEARDLGLILSDELLRGAEKTSDQLTRLSTVLDIKLKAALLNITPLIDDFVDGLLSVARSTSFVSLAFEGFSDVGARSIARLNFDLGATQKRIAELDDQIRTLERSALGRLRPELTQLPQLNRLLAEEERLRGQIQARLAFLQAPTARPRPPPPTPTEDPAIAAGERRTFLDRIDRAVTRAQRERDAALGILERFRVDALRGAGDVLGVIEARRSAQLERLGDLLTKNRILEEEAARARIDINVAADAEIAKSRQAQLDAVLARGLPVFEATRTAAERYALEIKKLVELLAEGAINQDTFNRAVAAAKKELDEASEAAEGLKDAGREMGQAIGTAFEDALIQGAKFRDLLHALEEDLLRIAQRQLITKPLERFFGGLLEDLFTGGGGVGGAAAVIPQPFFITSLRKGGVVGRDTPERRLVPASVFDDAPRFRIGGIAGLGPDEVPIIAHRGERITPAGKAGARAPITINFFIRTPDVGGFRKSQGQLAAEASRAMSLAAGRNN